MIDEIQEYIRCQLGESRHPVLLSSFGKDSVLLLHLTIPIKNVPVVWFRNKLNVYAEKVIKDLNLTVYTYPPIDQYLLPNETGYTLVSEYSVGEARLPMLTDIVEGEGELELNPHRMGIFQYPWNLSLYGMKRCDSHPIIGRPLDQVMTLGPTRLVAPLYGLTDEQVFEMLDSLGVEPPKEDGDMHVNASTLAEIRSLEWDREAALTTFRQRYGFKETQPSGIAR